VIACASVGLLYSTAKTTYLDAIRLDLLRLAEVAAAGVDVHLHQRLLQPGQFAVADYDQAVAPLRNILTNTRDIRFLYTVVLVDGEPHFVLDATPPGDADGDGVEDHSDLLERYDAPDTEMLCALREGRGTVMEESAADRWGEFLSAYAPLRDETGQCVGVVGVDVTAREFARRLATLQHAAIPAMLLAAILSGIVCWQIFRLRRKTLLHEWQREEGLRIVQRACERFECMLENVPAVAVQGFNRDGTITHWNRASTELYGISADRAIGTRMQDLLLTGTEVEHFEQTVKSLWESGQALPAHEWSVNAHEGREVRVLASMFPVAVGGEVEEVFCMDVDISERWRTEQSLLTRIQDLEETIDTVRGNADAAEKRCRSKSEFLAQMSHEIRTPMTAIVGFAEILLSEGGADASLVQDTEALRVIQRNGRHLLQLLNDLLDLSKIEAGQLALENTPVSIVELVADVSRGIRPQAERKGLSLGIEWATKVPESIRTDALRVKQVLNDVLGNAVQFTPSGGVRLKVHYENAAESSCMAFEIVMDSGLPGEQLAGLYQSCDREEGGGAGRFSSAGLGPAISRRLISMLQGELTVHTATGQATVVRIRIPVGEVGATRVLDMASTNSLADVKGRSDAMSIVPTLAGRILLVEDGPDNQRLLSMLLRNAGAEVVVADNGQRALDLIADSYDTPFDIVLMDMQMPVMDGYEATRRLRAAGITDLPIIAVTAHAQSSDREKCLEAGCDDYAAKPIHRGSLFAMITRHLNKKNSSQSDQGTSLSTCRGND
jgi:PAS domain S-box-containing protein